MIEVVCTKFGGPEVLELREVPTPEPGVREVRVRITSIGMNHADLMSRRGEYKLASGDPPFVPGIEGGGIVEAVGPEVTALAPGARVILTADAPRRSTSAMGGTYRSHYICGEKQVVLAPEALPDEQLGTLWLAYLTAWGCLAWKENLEEKKIVAFPAASSSVALAGAQIAKARGAVTIGMTTSADKVATIQSLPHQPYDHLVVTNSSDGKMSAWHRDLKKITAARGVDVFFDPVASGAYLDAEIRSLAQRGTIWVYGLLGEPGIVDVTPLIRKYASIRGWVLGELVEAGDTVLQQGYREILDGFESGKFHQQIAKVYSLSEVQQAHAEMETGKHIGKLVLVP
jgi:NADPH:quinone reductase